MVFYCLIILVLDGFFCLFFAVFLYKNRDKSLLYCGFDYSYLFDFATRNVNDNVCYDNFIIVFYLE